MRITREKAEANKAEVVAQASRLFRERGLDAPSVAELMRAAGLTHGGFYNHFPSKSDLQASALAYHFDTAVDRLGAATDATDPAQQMAGLQGYIARYLSPAARDASGAACPMVAFGADVSREGAKVREAYAAGLERYLSLLASTFASGREERPSQTDTHDPDQPDDARARAITLLATMAGGLSLARSIAATNPALSDEVLATVREQAMALADSTMPAEATPA